MKTLSLGGKPSVFRSPTRLQEYQLYVSKKQELQVAIEQAKREYNREKILFDKFLVSEEEYEKYLFTYQSKKEELSSLIESQLSTWQTELNNYQNQFKELQSAQNQEKAEVKDMYELRSPVDGTIEQFQESIVEAAYRQGNLSVASVLIPLYM